MIFNYRTQKSKSPEVGEMGMGSMVVCFNGQEVEKRPKGFMLIATVNVGTELNRNISLDIIPPGVEIPFVGLPSGSNFGITFDLGADTPYWSCGHHSTYFTSIKRRISTDYLVSEVFDVLPDVDTVLDFLLEVNEVSSHDHSESHDIFMNGVSEYIKILGEEVDAFLAGVERD